MGHDKLTILRGTLDILVLRTLANSAMHGYEISQKISRQSEDAFKIEEGVLYPALRRLENKGLLTAEWAESNTGREVRFYELTADGRAQLNSLISTWQRYVHAMDLILFPAEVR